MRASARGGLSREVGPDFERLPECSIFSAPFTQGEAMNTENFVLMAAVAVEVPE